MKTATKIAILGTGPVGQTLAAKLAELGHAVTIGTRDPLATLARAEPDMFGNPPFRVWREHHPSVGFGSLTQAAAHGEIIVNATSGAGSVDALSNAGRENLAGKIVVDVANPLDMSRGMPPSLSICNTDSLGEKIQRAFPECKVVKTLNTMNARLMVSPGSLSEGDHTVFLSGNDATAKETVRGILESFGWRDILDLGDITTARGTEMILPIWLRVWGATGSAMFNFKVVR